MKHKISISIPEPCHENWDAMTAVEKGRFCGSCQKNVFDFTSSSDREIINAFEKDNNLCGRFLNIQLNRDIVKPKEKSTIWLATTTALISFIGLGTHEAQAQGNAKIVKTDKKVLNNSVKTSNEDILVSGILYDDNNTPMPNIDIYVRNTKVGQTTANGNFSITTHLKAMLEFRLNSDDYYEDSAQHYVRNNFGNTNIEINAEKYRRHIKIVSSGLVALTVIEHKRTFFGRIFHSIGNLFR